MSDTTVIEGLKACLANTYTIYVKTQNYHWNVVGPNFHSLHLMFEGQYRELAVAVDDLAERLRALGVPAPGTFAEFTELATIETTAVEVTADGNALVRDLYDTHQALIAHMKTAREAAAAADDVATEDMLIERIKHHDKMSWMLKATLAE
ncbi:ferritin and Dps [Thecamonas trahens ATCC 50062]|uniref:Ferritin and Dps n=1 Tax=Thecamonas trahens ATCC 50062 TaxID=461836 RepID=A0A0L0D802_THETB|nr:ferritin and Dps [Thecamonas trahens ATCC 50062]KNC48479.1 ferritin and Dps [Thecamonas trahens ATCC 50062]|eukprot:XP_013758591.1 ferritin and Dps [Thecamonas trahens ATCC 50062]